MGNTLYTFNQITERREVDNVADELSTAGAAAKGQQGSKLNKNARSVTLIAWSLVFREAACAVLMRPQRRREGPQYSEQTCHVNLRRSWPARFAGHSVDCARHSADRASGE